MGEPELQVERGSSIAASVILFIVVGFQLLSRWFEHLKKSGSESESEVQLRAEITQLLKEASSLSQPSTFAQAAKLRRLAAAKEKELAKYQQSLGKDTKMSLDQNLKVLFIAKVITYFLLVCWFWKTPVAVVSSQLVQPFGRFLSWRTSGTLNNNVMVGIIPWLILSTRVSKFVSRLFNK